MNNVSNLVPKDKDGDDEFDAVSLNVESVSNGWILKVTDDEAGEEYTEVFPLSDGTGLINSIKEALGA